MKQLLKLRKQRVSGFTLLEMVVVVAIIAILTTILVPSVRGYLLKSKLNSANSEAKVLYNSIQTIMQEYEFRERQMSESAFYGEKKQGSFFIKGINGQIDTGSTFAKNSNGTMRTGTAITYTGADHDALGANPATAAADSFGARLARLYSDYDTVSWAAYVKNYTVRGVVCAESATSHYVGGYPLRASERVGDGDITATIAGTNLPILASYCVTAWNDGPDPEAAAPDPAKEE